MKQRCTCSYLAYRNNNDGKRDYKVAGKSSCRICRGSGWVKVCVACNGAGILNNERHFTCGGNGKVRVEG
jgi:DnaJ-class molecular chaperone